MTGTKLTLVPAQKQPVLIERGRMSLFSSSGLFFNFTNVLHKLTYTMIIEQNYYIITMLVFYDLRSCA